MYMGGGERSPINKSWGEWVKMKKLGVCMKKKIIGGGSEIVGVPLDQGDSELEI